MYHKLCPTWVYYIQRTFQNYERFDYSERYIENKYFFHFLTPKNAGNVKITHINDISQGMPSLSLFHPKGPFRIVKGFLVLKLFRKYVFISLLAPINAGTGKITHINDISQAMPNLSLFHAKRPFRILKGLIILKGISKICFFHFLAIKMAIMGK